jgi:serine protease Do
MKQVLSFVLAGVVGGLVVLGGLQVLSPDKSWSITSPDPVNLQPRAITYSSAKGLIDFREAAALARPAVVHISAIESRQRAIERGRQNNPFHRFFGEDFFFGAPFEDMYRPRQGSGSGVIYTSDGYIVTNNHVIEFADELEVTLFDNRKFRAKVVGSYPKTDLAILKIEASGLPVLPLADSDAAEVGEWVLAVGNPMNLTSTVTAGIISAKGRNINIINQRDAIESFIQTDAAVNPGNSGGALVNAQGHLLGINTAISSRTGSFEGYSFAIPVNIVRKIADDIIEYGSFQRAYLGVSIFELDSDYAAQAGLNFTQGVVVDRLEEGGSAQYAGLLPQDVIVAVDGRSVKSIPELQEIVGRSKVGDIISVTIYRNGSKQDIPVRLKAAG